MGQKIKIQDKTYYAFAPAMADAEKVEVALLPQDFQMDDTLKSYWCQEWSERSFNRIESASNYVSFGYNIDNQCGSVFDRGDNLLFTLKLSDGYLFGIEYDENKTLDNYTLLTLDNTVFYPDYVKATVNYVNDNNGTLLHFSNGSLLSQGYNFLFGLGSYDFYTKFFPSKINRRVDTSAKRLDIRLSCNQFALARNDSRSLTLHQYIPSPKTYLIGFNENQSPNLYIWDDRDFSSWATDHWKAETRLVYSDDTQHFISGGDFLVSATTKLSRCTKITNNIPYFYKTQINFGDSDINVDTPVSLLSKTMANDNLAEFTKTFSEFYCATTQNMEKDDKGNIVYKYVSTPGSPLHYATDYITNAQYKTHKTTSGSKISYTDIAINGELEKRDFCDYFYSTAICKFDILYHAYILPRYGINPATLEIQSNSTSLLIHWYDFTAVDGDPIQYVIWQKDAITHTWTRAFSYTTTTSGYINIYSYLSGSTSNNYEVKVQVWNTRTKMNGNYLFFQDDQIESQYRNGQGLVDSLTCSDAVIFQETLLDTGKQETYIKSSSKNAYRVANTNSHSWYCLPMESIEIDPITYSNSKIYLSAGEKITSYELGNYVRTYKKLHSETSQDNLSDYGIHVLRGMFNNSGKLDDTIIFNNTGVSENITYWSNGTKIRHFKTLAPYEEFHCDAASVMEKFNENIITYRTFASPDIINYTTTSTSGVNYYAFTKWGRRQTTLTRASSNVEETNMALFWYNLKSGDSTHRFIITDAEGNTISTNSRFYNWITVNGINNVMVYYIPITEIELPITIRCNDDNTYQATGFQVGDLAEIDNGASGWHSEYIALY